MERLKHAWFMLLELILRGVINPYLRARLLRWCGATIGNNVRIYEMQLLNLTSGFRNLVIEDDVHVGMGCRFDLRGPVVVRRGATVSPGVTIMTHVDPGSHHGSPLCQAFPPTVAGVEIGEYSWIGCNATILAGSTILRETVVGACSLVKGNLGPESVYAGVPAQKLRTIRTDRSSVPKL